MYQPRFPRTGIEGWAVSPARGPRLEDLENHAFARGTLVSRTHSLPTTKKKILLSPGCSLQRSQRWGQGGNIKGKGQDHCSDMSCSDSAPALGGSQARGPALPIMQRMGHYLLEGQAMDMPPPAAGGLGMPGVGTPTEMSTQEACGGIFKKREQRVIKCRRRRKSQG